VQGSLGGEWVKRSLNTRDWSVAAATIHEWEAAREVGGKKLDVPTIREALQKYSAWPLVNQSHGAPLLALD
jgi:hypothetical protein